MANMKINKERLIELEGECFRNKYDLFDALFNNITSEYKKTVVRNGEEYIKTCIKQRTNDYLMKKIAKHCELVQLGNEYVIEEVYTDKIA